MAHCVNKMFGGAAVDFFHLAIDPWWWIFSFSYSGSSWPLHALAQEHLKKSYNSANTSAKKKVLIRCSIRFSSYAVNLPMPPACGRVCEHASTESNLPWVASHRPYLWCDALFNDYIQNELFYSHPKHIPFFDSIWDWKRMSVGSEHRTNENYTYNCIKHVDRINWCRALSATTRWENAVYISGINLYIVFYFVAIPLNELVCT